MSTSTQIFEQPTYRRLLCFAAPAIGMMLLESTYSIVDGFFVSNYAGKTAFAAVNLAIPALMILTLGTVFGAGGSAIVANTLGEGRRTHANQYFSLFTAATAGVSLVLALVGFLLAVPILHFLGAEDALLADGVLYMRIALCSLPFYALQMYFEPFFSTAGKPHIGFYFTCLSGMMNILLDAILVIGLPQEYKLMGAALSTAASACIGGGAALMYFYRRNDSLLRLERPRFEWLALRRAVTNGSSEFMSNISMSLVGMLYNMQLLRYAGENGVAAYGFIIYVSFLFAAAFLGYSIGVAPLAGYQNGAKNYPKLRSVLKRSLIIIAAFGTLMLVSSQLLIKPLAAIFVGYDAELYALTISGFRIYSFCFFFMGFSIYASSFFTALNDGLTSALISFLRSFLFEAGAVLLLPLWFGIDGIWYSVVVAELLSFLMCGGFLYAKRARLYGN